MLVKAVKAMELSGLYFGAVDVMIDGQGRSFVSEINTSPEVLGEYQQGCVAKAIDYMVEKGRVPVVKGQQGWKGYVHPCITNKAVVD